MFPSYGNRSVDLKRKSTDCFQYDRKLVGKGLSSATSKSFIFATFKN